MHLSQIRCRYPDWQKVAVYSDYLEDTNNLPLAQALRWLMTNNHWPFLQLTERPPIYYWFIQNPHTRNLSYSRYISLDDDPEEPYYSYSLALRRASLPPCFYRSTKDCITSYTFSEAIHRFSTLFASLEQPLCPRPAVYSPRTS